MNRSQAIVLPVIAVFLLSSSSVFAAGPGHLLFARPHAPTYVLGSKVPLFSGNSLENWMTASGDEVRPGWVLNDGVLHREQRAGDIISKKTYEYFVLEFDWKIVEGANSGVKYRYRKFGNRWLGCEYQILDDERSSELNPKNQTGSLYDVYAPDASKHLKPAGEFNHTKIVVFGNRIEHWLNDQRVLVVHTGTNDWRKHIAESKFNEAKGFGENRYGRLMFQDHGGEIWFQNVTIQEYRQVECRPRFFR